MKSRDLLPLDEEELIHAPAVARLGPRQVGKTTLALELGRRRPSVYLDLQSEADRSKLASPKPPTLSPTVPGGIAQRIDCPT